MRDFALRIPPSVIFDRSNRFCLAFASKRGLWANIPPRCNRNEPICFSPYLYRARNLVERFFNRIKQCRRIATRYDKLAANYLAFVQLASIRLWLRVNESTPLMDTCRGVRSCVAAVPGRHRDGVERRKRNEACHEPTDVRLPGD